MNRIIRNLVITIPLATVGLTMVNVTAATAGPNGPDVIVIKPKGGDPLPPKPPKNLDLPVKDAPKPKGPNDKAPKPAPKPQGGNEVAAAPKAADKTDEVVEVISAKGSPDSIDRNEALFVAGPAETTLVADDSDNGVDLTWLLLGGGIVTASGIAFAARKRTNA